jgi:hypothetical protein
MTKAIWNDRVIAESDDKVARRKEITTFRRRACSPSLDCRDYR